MNNDPYLPNLSAPVPARRTCNKVTYPDKKAAVTQKNAIMHRRHNRPDGLRPYYCYRCNGWHLTRKE